MPISELRKPHGIDQCVDARDPTLATALASAFVAIAGTVLAMKTNFDPTIGPSRLLIAFEAVIIGGMGNIWGTLAIGITLGVAQAIGAQIDAGYQILAGHLAFLAVLILRTSGLFTKAGGQAMAHVEHIALFKTTDNRAA